MILKIFSPKNLAKIFAFFASTTVSFCKNCDHNIDPWGQFKHLDGGPSLTTVTDGRLENWSQSYDF
jgi:hypothetical protein